MKNKFLFGFLFFLWSCNSNPEFDNAERLKARLFLEVIEYDNQSARLSNSQKAFGKISLNDIAKILELQKLALLKAEEIPTDILQKMHKDLEPNFKKYMKGLRLRINNLETGNITNEMEGSRLVDEWVDWYGVHGKKIKIPK